MQNAFFVVGPTAVGKTGLAVEVAARVGAEIVSADAYQVYRGFPLLTAKPTPEQQRRVAHGLLGYVDLTETYQVARFHADATEAISRASRDGRPVLVVGGNGLYVKSLTHGLATLPPPLPELRAQLEATPLPGLLERLWALDPVAHARLDRQNARRVVRAVEVCLLTGRPFSSFQTGWREIADGTVPRGILLTRDRADLVARINRRVDEMFAQGVVDEVRCALGQALSPTAGQILGLADIRAYLAGQIGLPECRERISIATRQYAKRQMTWFKRETCFAPVTLSANAADSEQGVEQVRQFFQVWLDTNRLRKSP